MDRAADIVYSCLKEKKLTQKELAKRMGEDSRKINQQLKVANDMKFGRFVDVLDNIGYEVKIVEKCPFSDID